MSLDQSLHYAFAGSLTVCGVVVWKSWPGSNDSEEITPRFVAFQRNYIAIWLCMMMADWLQGPYVYAL